MAVQRGANITQASSGKRGAAIVMTPVARPRSEARSRSGHMALPPFFQAKTDQLVFRQMPSCDFFLSGQRRELHDADNAVDASFEIIVGELSRDGAEPPKASDGDLAEEIGVDIRAEGAFGLRLAELIGDDAKRGL